MKSFKNSAKYGQTSENLSESMLKGEWQNLKENSLKTCINATPLGHDGIEQRRGYQISCLENTQQNFVQFPLKLSKTEAQILIYQNRIIINIPETEKYFITPLEASNIYNITSIQDVLTNGKDQLFIASSRGIDVFNINQNFFNATSGSNILTLQATQGLDGSSITGANTNTYLYLFQGLKPILDVYPFYPSYFASNITPFVPRDYSRFYVGAPSAFYIEVSSSFGIGDTVNTTVTLPFSNQETNASSSYLVSGKIIRRIRGFKYTNNGLVKIYPFSTLPIQNPNFPTLITVPSSATSVELFEIDNISLFEFLKPTLNIFGTITSYNIYPRIINDLSYVVIGLPDANSVTVGEMCFTNQNVLVTSVSNEGQISNKGFSMYMNTDNRLYIAYDNVVKASEVGNYTNFVVPTTDTEKGDLLTALSPLNLSLQGVTNIKWIWKLRDRGTLFGTDAGIKLLNYGASSFRAGISDISDLVPSEIHPISATINGIGGVAFANNEKNKIMFLASQSTLQTPADDLTKYVDFFLTDRIKKIVSVQFLSGEMMMVLTEKGKCFRLITGGNDKFGWVEDQFYIQEEYNFISDLPAIGEFRVWYLVKYTTLENKENNILTNIYYVWDGIEYKETPFNSITIYDISTYQEKLVIIFNISNIPTVNPVKIIGILNMENETTVDLYRNVPTLDYIFTMPEIIFINQNRNLPIYFLSQINQSFLDAVIQPQEMYLETHYDEYMNRGKNSKFLNRQIVDRVINGDNLYNVKIGYNGLRTNIIGASKWYKMTSGQKTIKRKDVDENNVLISGNIPINPSSLAPLLTCTIKSRNLIPTKIKSDSYTIKFP